MAALLLHFPAECRVLDNILFFVRKAVLFKHRPNAITPAAMSLHVGNDLRIFHTIFDKYLLLGLLQPPISAGQKLKFVFWYYSFYLNKTKVKEQSTTLKLQHFWRIATRDFAQACTQSCVLDRCHRF